MSYDYNTYYRQDCIVPLLLMSFGVFLTIKVGLSLISSRSGEKLIVLIKQNVPKLVCLLVCIFLITINLVHLFRGGIFLLFEKEDQAIQISGVVDELVSLDALTGAKYNVAQNHGRGEAILIDGRRYYLTTFGDIKVGDYVLLIVLPKSGFVLKMEKQ